MSENSVGHSQLTIDNSQKRNAPGRNGCVFLITKTTVMKKSIKYYFIVLPHSVS